MTRNKTENSVSAQCQRLLAFLEGEGRIATSECRELLNIMHPAGRIKDLRSRGYNIFTLWRYVADANGVMHRQGVYVLRRGVQ